ncbi:MAG: hypothetical protein KTR20_04335 [Cellvibrionaceae bacterium]|nr:hypothetical protein [Cellvibrionaceae bacterium]
MMQIKTTTCNPAWGFWGTIKADKDQAWSTAIAHISEATQQPLEAVRAFLDSRYGRHFADDVNNGLFKGQPLPDAVSAATHRWMQWRITRRINKDHGIPFGLPYLIGFVIHCEIADREASIG